MSYNDIHGSHYHPSPHYQIHPQNPEAPPTLGQSIPQRQHHLPPCGESYAAEVPEAFLSSCVFPNDSITFGREPNSHTESPKVSCLYVATIPKRSPHITPQLHSLCRFWQMIRRAIPDCLWMTYHFILQFYDMAQRTQ